MAIDKLGNGIGYLYITDANSNIVATWPNYANSVRPFLAEALVSGPLSGEVLATSTVTFTATSGGGTVTNLTVNGVSIMGVVAATGATNTALAAAVATKINSTISTPDYDAFSVAGVLTIQPKAGTRSTVNGYVTVVSSSSTTATVVNMAGGASASGIYSTGVSGRRFYIYADAGAAVGSISGATEVSSNIIQRGTQAGEYISTATIATGAIAVTRPSADSQIIVDTESAAASDDLDTISTAGYVTGDTIIVRGANAGRIVTVTDAGNITLANDLDFLSGSSANAIVLQYVSATDRWYEVSRSPGLSFATASVRSTGVIPWPVPGITSTTLTNGGGTISLTPGSSKGILYLSGTPSLAANWSVVGAGSPIDGDTFYVYYRAVPTLNGNTITIFGSLLTDVQAVSGKIYVRATYSSTLVAYTTVVFDDVTGVDFATVASVAAKENDLGTPAANGYVLSSTTADVRSWIPSPGSTIRCQEAVTLSGAAYSATMDVADTAYVDGNGYYIKPNTTSVEGVTLNLNAIGAKNLVKQGGVRINIGDLIVNRWYLATYNSTLDAFEINLPRVIVAEYSFAALTGVTATYDLTSDIPIGVVLQTSNSTIMIETAMTSGGSSLTSWGVTSATDLIDATHPYDGRRYFNGVYTIFKPNNLAYGSMTITGGSSGTIDTLTIAGVNVMNGAVTYASSITNTALLVASNINSNPNSTVRAEASGAIIYLYPLTVSKYQGIYTGTSTQYAVSATATTMTVGTFVDIGAANIMRNNYDAGYYLTGAKRITFTISGANLTAGKLRAFIPYDVIQ